MRSTWSIVLVWAAVLLMVYWAFSQFIAQQYQPKMSVSHRGSESEITLTRARDGHFRLAGSINGEPVTLLLDTGATSVTINAQLAQRLNLPRGEVFVAQTANGAVEGYQSHLERLSFGPFIFDHVAVGVMPNLGDEVLLGMNIIKLFNIQTQNNQMQLKLIAE